MDNEPLSKKKQTFLRLLQKSWETEFPFLKPLDLDEVPRVPRGCNFCCGDYYIERHVYYFVTIDFSERSQGEFSVSLTVSHSANKSLFDPPLHDPSPTNIGTYAISQFMGRQWYCWDLVDVDGQSKDLFRSLGVPMDDCLPTNPHAWHPSSYDLPFEEIAQEAIGDVNDKLCQFVFPVLGIDIAGQPPSD